MATSVDISPYFAARLKKLARKYPSVLGQVDALTDQLASDERLGDLIPQVGYEVYKVRLKNPSASKGKSGGFRVIYYVQLADKLILVALYVKSEQTDISPDQIRQLIEDLPPSDESDET